MTKVIVASPVWSLNGVNTFSAGLVRGLRDAGLDARLILTGVTYTERKPFPLPRDVRVEHFNLPPFATWPRRLRAFREYLEAEAPCIYLPNHDFQHSQISPVLSSRVGIVGIVHSDDEQHHDHVARLGGSWNATVAVSEAIATRVLHEGSVEQRRLEVIPYGVGAAKSFPQRNDDAELRILYTGRIESTQKRSGDLIEIADRLMKRGVAFHMTIVGDGPERAELEREMSDRNLSRHVTMMKSVSNDRIPDICGEHDVFVLPSAYEGMPLGLLEAMGQGCIPVATDIGSGIPELITNGENGFRVGVGRIDEFAARLSEISESPQLRLRLSRNAWSTVAGSPFERGAMISRYLKVFETVSNEIASGSFRRTGRIAPAHTSLRDRIAAPLWFLRPSVRAQQNIAR